MNRPRVARVMNHRVHSARIEGAEDMAAKKTAKKATTLRRVIVRTQSAGVHYGTLVSREGDEVVLDGARRIWRWFGANTCSEIALHGIDSAKSRVAKPVDGHRIKGWIEILPCSDSAAATIEAAEWAP